MKVRNLILAAILACGTATVSAQEIVGNWNVTLDSPMRAFVMAFEFMVEEGSTLVGSMFNDMIGQLPISDGEVDGAEVAFKTLIEFGADVITMSFSGELEGDELTLTMAMEGAPPGGGAEEPQTFVATRAE